MLLQWCSGRDAGLVTSMSLCDIAAALSLILGGPTQFAGEQNEHGKTADSPVSI